MGGNSQSGNGQGDPAPDSGTEEVSAGENGSIIQRRIDEAKFAQAGFMIPRQNTVLDSARFWELTAEGWRFVVAEDGAIVAYLPPPLASRLAAWTKTRKFLSMQRLLKGERH